MMNLALCSSMEMKMTTKTRKPRKATQRTPKKSPLTRWLDAVAAQNVLLPDRRKVVAYCRQFPRLARLMPEIAARVREFFGPGVQLLLLINKDPEIDDPYLKMYVRVDSYQPDLMDRIEKVNAEFHDWYGADDGYFHLTTDFRKPLNSNGI
jgi:hypothetical protein